MATESIGDAPKLLISGAAHRYDVFAREFVIDGNATRAAIAAGYAEGRASVKGSELVRNGKVRKLIEKLQTQRASKLELKADRIAEELQRLAFANMLDYMNVEDGRPRLDFSTLTRDQAAAIQEIKEDTTGGTGDGERKAVLRTTFKLADKGANLERLARHLGMFKDTINVNVSVSLADAIQKRRQLDE